jgi:hypothetical protein
VPNHLAKLDGLKIFEALYTITNEYEEIKAQCFTVTKAHDEAKQALVALNDGLHLLGHDEEKAMFTDKHVLLSRTTKVHRSKHVSIRFTILKKEYQTDW